MQQKTPAGQLPELERVIWLAMDLGQRPQLQVICPQPRDVRCHRLKEHAGNEQTSRLLVKHDTVDRIGGTVVEIRLLLLPATTGQKLHIVATRITANQITFLPAAAAQVQRLANFPASSNPLARQAVLGAYRPGIRCANREA